MFDFLFPLRTTSAKELVWKGGFEERSGTGNLGRQRVLEPVDWMKSDGLLAFSFKHSLILGKRWRLGIGIGIEHRDACVRACSGFEFLHLRFGVFLVLLRDTFHEAF